MNTGLGNGSDGWSAIAESVKRNEEAKRDYRGPASMLHMNHDGLIEVEGLEKEYRPTSFALGQIADGLGIPRSYTNKLKEDAPDLLSDNFNYWWNKTKEQRLFRTLEHEGGDNQLRAYLSSKYRILDNLPLFGAVVPILTEENNFTLQSANITDTRLYLKATLPALRAEVKKGDVVEYGLVISNSEVGSGSIKVEPLLYRLICENGMISSSSVRKHHIGRRVGSGDSFDHLLTDSTIQREDALFWDMIADIVRGSLREDVFRTEIEKLKVAAAVPINSTKMEKVIDVTRRKFSLSEEIGSKVLNNLIRNKDYTKWGLANAVTFAANGIKDYEKSTELEEVGGKIIELSPSEWKVISEAA